jgi:hypothetical protein
LVLIQGRRPDQVGTCPWLSYFAPLALLVQLSSQTREALVEAVDQQLALLVGVIRK